MNFTRQTNHIKALSGIGGNYVMWTHHWRAEVVKMKKIVCVLFSLIVLVSSTFADKSLFYENDKVIDTMYVDSEEGLRVRDNPSLKSNRLCGLPHRPSCQSCCNWKRRNN